MSWYFTSGIYSCRSFKALTVTLFPKQCELKQMVCFAFVFFMLAGTVNISPSSEHFDSGIMPGDSGICVFVAQLSDGSCNSPTEAIWGHFGIRGLIISLNLVTLNGLLKFSRRNLVWWYGKVFFLFWLLVCLFFLFVETGFTFQIPLDFVFIFKYI